MPVSTISGSKKSRKSRKPIVLTCLGLLFAALVAGATILHHFWPFVESSVRSRLAAEAAASVRFGSFRNKYFPPGCVIENVVFQRNNSGPPLISIRRLTITSNLSGLLRHHVSVMRADGLHLTLARSDFSGNQESNHETTVDELLADDAVLEVLQKGRAQPLRFTFHKFQMENLGAGGATKFAAVFDNPMPAGLIQTSGEFGPWNSSDPAATPVSGKYSLLNADLGVFKSIGGTLSSDGDFRGTFKRMEVEGSTITPEFEVRETHHKLPLRTRFEAVVNPTNGETVLQNVNARFGRDEIEAHGSIGRGPHGKRAAIVDLTCEHGRVEDTFYPFIKAAKSPLTGNVTFQMHVVIPSGQEPFLKRVEFKSDFRIQNATFTNPRTESRLSKVSERPGQKQPEDPQSVDLQGQVSVNSSIAHFSKLSLQDGEASAWFLGNYDLLDERVNMHGKLSTKASLTNTTSGIKAAFAKVLEPLFKKGRHKKVVPVKIGGTYHNPNFALDISPHT